MLLLVPAGGLFETPQHRSLAVTARIGVPVGSDHTPSEDAPNHKGVFMFYPDSFKITMPTDYEILIRRDFHAPRQLVFDAFTKPELVRQWLLGPSGWTMPVCEIDLQVGGMYRYVWRKDGVKDMGIGGVFREVVVPARLVATEKFDDSWYPGEALDTTVFIEAGDITKLELRVLYESKEARDTASRSGMEHGMVAGYNRLEEMLQVRGRA